jgi:ribosomal protein S18 acetylase RimI-like enzyme
MYDPGANCCTVTRSIMPEIEIRPLLLPDIPVISKLEHYYQSNYVWQMDRNSDTGQINILFREIRLPRPVQVDYSYQPDQFTEETFRQYIFLVAALNGNVVGYVGIKEITSSNTAWVSNIVVKNGLRRKGIASALLLAAQEWAVQRRLWFIVIEAQSKNHPGIRLAQKLGYEFSGYNDHFYLNQDIALFFSRYLR